ncbi:MAG: hypothetical protein K2G56_02385 [Eubacterium sp.]|nr:hypothetical protein [Eubacterium sp.]
MSNVVVHLIYLRNEIVLSKKHYNHWKEIQDEYDDYVTNMFFSTSQDLISFFKKDFKDECYWPFSEKDIVDFFSSDQICISSN